MANLHRVQETILAAYISDVLDEEEFTLLYDINRPSNLDFQYEGYQLDLENLNDDECKSYFRQEKKVNKSK